MSNLSRFTTEELRNIAHALEEWATLAEVAPHETYDAIDKELRKRSFKVVGTSDG